MSAQTSVSESPQLSTLQKRRQDRPKQKFVPAAKLIFYKRKVFWVLFAVPNILSALYFGVVATPQYVSESSLVVYQANQTDTQQPVRVQLSANGGGVSLEGDYLVAKYMRSWQCFSRQDPTLLAAMWRRGDIVSRFGGVLDLFLSNPTQLWRYYQSHVRTSIDESSAILTVRVIGYDRDFAQHLNTSVLKAADVAVNKMNQQAFENAEAFFKQRVVVAKEHLHTVILGLSNLQQQNHVVDPHTDYQAQLTLLNNLIDKKITLEAQLNVFQRATPGSQRVDNLTVELQALNEQIETITKNIHGDDNALTKISGPYAYQQALIENAEATLKQNEYQLLTAQQTALQHQYFLEYVDHPSVPPNPTLPHRLRWIFGILAVTFSLYVVVK